MTSIDQISPELAALIVKRYILPMFESDAKRSLDSKFNRLRGVSRGTKKQFKFATIGDARDPNSVYGELKLSEKLVEELDVIREHVDDLNEQLEEAVYTQNLYKSKF